MTHDDQVLEAICLELNRTLKSEIAELAVYTSDGAATHHACTMEQLQKTIEEVRALGPILSEIHGHPETLRWIGSCIRPPRYARPFEMVFPCGMMGIRFVEDETLPPWSPYGPLPLARCIRKVYSNT